MRAFRTFGMALLAVAGLLVATGATAQEEDTLTGSQVERDAESLREYLRSHPIERDRVNTALVFANAVDVPARVDCVAFGPNGRALGAAWLVVPGRGLRYLRASDLVHGRDFVGPARCRTRARVRATAVVGAPGGISDVQVAQGEGPGLVRIFFPLVASY